MNAWYSASSVGASRAQLIDGAGINVSSYCTRTLKHKAGAGRSVF